MSLRSTGVLALVAMILGGIIYWYEIAGESTRQAARDDEQRILPGLESGTVDMIALSTQDGVAARFERRDGRWTMISPVAGRADATALDAMAQALANLPREGRVANSGETDEYGLGSEARRIRFVADGKPGELLIGRSTPVGGHVYVAALSDGEDSAVEYVERYRVNAFNRNLDDLRERQILKFEGAELRTLRISWPATDGRTEVALARDDSGQWQMGVPLVDVADQQTLRDLISDLSYLRATGFLDVRTDEADAALANPAIAFHWTLSGEHLESRMRIGLTNPPIVEGPEGQRFTIDAERMDEFPRAVVAYRFKTVSEFDLVDARYLELEFEGDEEAASVEPMRVEARLGEAGWSGTEPAIDSTRASDLVRQLASLRAVDIFADEMGPAELASLGLAPPRVRIRIENRLDGEGDPTILAELKIGRLDPGRGLFAQRQGASTIYVLPASAAEDIPISREAFANEFEAGSSKSAVEIGPEDVDVDVDVDPLEGVEIP
jgi:hypothetical protein